MKRNGQPVNPLSKSSVTVWDLPVRIFHWSIAILFGISWWSGTSDSAGMEIHEWSGYAILTLVIFRVLWGWVGGTTARFSHFLVAPRRAFAYLRTLFSRQPSHWVGHSPTGGWAVMLLLAALATQAMLGLFSNDDILFDGPLSAWVGKSVSDAVTGFHSEFFDVLLVLVAIHIGVVLYYVFGKKENLIRPMFSGRKELPQDKLPAEPVRAGGLFRAAMTLAFSAAVVYLVISLPTLIG